MPLTFNIRHLEKRDLALDGELFVQDLELEGVDELIELSGPITYHLKVERLSDSILVQGTLSGTLACQCARCLEPFEEQLALGSWTRSLPLEGEEKVLITNDCVDLTPYVREDILLAFPQHPLCEPECRGLLESVQGSQANGSSDEQNSGATSAWSELNKLKF